MYNKIKNKYSETSFARVDQTFSAFLKTVNFALNFKP